MKVPYPQLEAQGITNWKVLHALRNLPRELFVLEEYQALAYENSPLPINCGQTISQPFIVAYMTEQLELKPTEKVLEIGTGSGFQTGVLAQLVQEVYTIEIFPELSQSAQQRLEKLGYRNIKYKVGDGKLGWVEFAPFEAILITAAAPEIPALLLQQLKCGGRMILPLVWINGEQHLVLVNKLVSGKVKFKLLMPVKFVTLK